MFHIVPLKRVGCDQRPFFCEITWAAGKLRAIPIPTKIAVFGPNFTIFNLSEAHRNANPFFGTPVALMGVKTKTKGLQANAAKPATKEVKL